MWSAVAPQAEFDAHTAGYCEVATVDRCHVRLFQNVSAVRIILWRMPPDPLQDPCG